MTRRIVWALGLAVPFLLLGGCESIFGIGELPLPDGGSDVQVPDGGAEGSSLNDAQPLFDGPPPIFESGPPPDGPAPSCYANGGFVALPWVPPTPFGQPSCSEPQITSYLTCTFGSGCGAFRMNPQNGACVACLETDVNAAAYGPLVTVGGSPFEVNYGGCQAHFDMSTGPGSCGDIVNDFFACVENECSTCPDFSTAQAGGPTALCEQFAFAGPCGPYLPPPSCELELGDGGVAAACNDIGSFLPFWCVPPPDCFANTAFPPMPWAPPTPFNQGMCNVAQIQAYEDCLALSDCTAFRTTPVNQPCLGCIETLANSASFGPVITGGSPPIIPNFGGCVANYDNDTGASGCGAQTNNLAACVQAECSTCSDFGDAGHGGPTDDCLLPAVNGGPCAPYFSSACRSEREDGGIASPCATFDSMLKAWCD